MPLYMDIHTVDSEDFSVEDVVTAHMKDLAVQEKYGVLQIKYWVDTDNKKIFCLMEGPSKEACNAVHLESHGNTACNIIEVSDDEYNLFLNNGKTKEDLAHKDTGDIDAGYRTFLLINTNDFTGKFHHYTNQIYKLTKRYNGLNIAQANKGIFVYFTDTINALMCAIEIDRLLKTIPESYEYWMTLVTGNPVDTTGENIFEETKSTINTISNFGLNRKIYVDTTTNLIIKKEPYAPKMNSEIFKIITDKDYLIIKKINQIFNTHLYNSDFNVKKLNLLLGLSKAQSYRIIKQVTGLSPIQMIHELRLRRSLDLLKSNTKTVAEVAYDLGFNSPTYFTRVFRKRFQILPTTFVKMS